MPESCDCAWKISGDLGSSTWAEDGGETSIRMAFIIRSDYMVRAQSDESARAECGSRVTAH
jgi:hypothetical protein